MAWRCAAVCLSYPLHRTASPIVCTLLPSFIPLHLFCVQVQGLNLQLMGREAQLKAQLAEAQQLHTQLQLLHTQSLAAAELAAAASSALSQRPHPGFEEDRAFAQPAFSAFNQQPYAGSDEGRAFSSRGASDEEGATGDGVGLQRGWDVRVEQLSGELAFQCGGLRAKCIWVNRHWSSS